ncbi:thioesterase II family protein [Nonomuraea ferruginea]
MVYQPLADALPEECALYSMAFPGHDPGRPDEPVMPLEEVIEQAVREILDGIDGPIALYGHCGIGGAVTAEVARRLEARGREPAAVYIGAIFPFARPEGRIAGPLGRLLRTDRLRGDRSYENRMKAMGNDISGLDEEQVKFMVRNQRRDTLIAEEAFTRMLAERAEPLRPPVIAVVGEQDPATDYYRERYREWHFLSETTALVVLDEAEPLLPEVPRRRPGPGPHQHAHRHGVRLGRRAEPPGPRPGRRMVGRGDVGPGRSGGSAQPGSGRPSPACAGSSPSRRSSSCPWSAPR